MDDKQGPWSSQTRLVVTLLLVALGIYLLFRFSTLLTPVILACILAFILSPAVNLFENGLHIKRGWATLITYLIMISVVITMMAILVPMLASQWSDLTQDAMDQVQRLEGLLGRQFVIAGQVIDVEALTKQAGQMLQGLLSPLFSQTLGLAFKAVTYIVWGIFIIVVSFYLVKDASALHAWLENLAPAPFRPDYLRLRDEINHIWSAFFRGQLVLAIVVACIFSLAGFILGMPFALAMGVLAGLLEFLPSLGHGIWLVSASLLAFSLGSTWIPVPHFAFMLIIIVLHLFFEQFDVNYLIPRIIGRSVHLPPLAIILGISAGAVLAGVIGILLAAPVIASARVIGHYIYANLFDTGPFVEEMTEQLPPPDPRWWQKRYSRLKAVDRAKAAINRSVPKGEANPGRVDDRKS